MNFGKNRGFLKNKKLIFSIDKTGIGEEAHPTIKKRQQSVNDYVPEKKMYQTLTLEEENYKKVKKQILNVLNKEVKIPLLNSPKINKVKLYLNMIKCILFKKSEKSIQSRISFSDKLKQSFVKWWRKETTDDLKDLVNFVFIHGCLGAFTIISLLTIFNIDILLVQIIKQSVILTIFTFTCGTGAGYYLFLDVNAALKDVWKMRKR